MALFVNVNKEQIMTAALEMQAQVAQFSDEWNESRSEIYKIAVGIGVHVGNLILGAIGEPERCEITVISDVVNVASRLEGLNKILGTSIIVSKEFLESEEGTKLNPNQFQMRRIGYVELRGHALPIEVFEVFDGHKNQPKLAYNEIFDKAVSYYQSQNFHRAHTLFHKILQLNPHDKVVQIYLNHTSIYITNNSAEPDFNGALKLNSEEFISTKGLPYTRQHNYLYVGQTKIASSPARNRPTRGAPRRTDRLNHKSLSETSIPLGLSPTRIIKKVGQSPQTH